MNDKAHDDLEGLSWPATRGARSVFFVSLPKSGTVYTWNLLQDMTGLTMPNFHLMEGWAEYNKGRDFSCPDLYACGDYNTQLLIPEGMKNFMKGFIFGAHMQASYHNMRILNESGIKRITVLLRDPRDAFVSWVHHLRMLGPSARNYHSKIYHIPRAYYEWSLEEQFRYQIRTFLPTTVNWVEGWFDYYASGSTEVDIQFVYYDELKRAPARYIRRITEFHGLSNVDFGKLIAPEEGKMHFRKGQHGQWQEDISTADQRLVENLMQDRIPHGYAAAAKRHPGLAMAESDLNSGNKRKAAEESLKTVIQFPNYRPAYEILFRATESCGAKNAVLRSLVESELHDPSIADLFIYRYELVDACGELVCSSEARK
jgi:hypothetical protein